MALSVGFPWGIYVAPTYNCGEHKVARATSSSSGRKKYFTQYNNGNIVKIGGDLPGWETNKKPKNLCLSSRSSTRVHVGGSSDFWSIDSKIGVKV